MATDLGQICVVLQWVYGLVCVAVGLGVVGGGSLFWINFSGGEFGVCG